MNDRLMAWQWALLALLSRLPFALRHLWDHDSVQFALATERFDLAAHQPHPPGYPLYIGALEALGWLGLSPHWAMIVLSAAGAALGAAFTVRLLARWSGDAFSAHLGAALYVTNPLLWFYGELPLVYAVEGGLTVFLAYRAVTMAEAGRRAFFFACVAFALAGGLRPSTLVLLFPLFLFGLAQALRARRLRWRDLPTGAALGLLAVGVWLLPLVLAAGGWRAYRSLSGGHFDTLLPQTSVLFGAGVGALGHNLEVLIKWALQGLVPAAVVGLLALVSGFLRRAAIATAWAALRRRLPWLLVWAGPPMLFFALFHITKAGYTLVHLPALLIATALVLGNLLAGIRDLRRPLALAGAVIVGAGLFLFGADRRADQSRAWAVVRHEHNVGELRAFERDLEQMVTLVRSYDPIENVLVGLEVAGTGAAGSDGYLYSWHRHLQWYLPWFHSYFLAPSATLAAHSPGEHRPFEAVGPVIELPPGARHLILVLADLPGERLALTADLLWRSDTFAVLRMPLRRPLRLGGLEIRPAASAGERPALRDDPAGRRSSAAPPAAASRAGGRN